MTATRYNILYYCGECIPQDKRRFDAVWELKSAIEEVEFERYASLRAQANGIMMASHIRPSSGPDMTNRV